VACAITEERDVGIDVESVRNGPIVDRVSDRHFSSSEIETLARVSSAARAQTFFDYWTLKEAYIKARGMGFGIPLDKFSFHLSDAAAPKISFVSGFPDDASCWQFALYPLGPRHRLAVAVQRDPSTEIRFELTAATPAPGVMRTPIGTCAATGSAGQNPDGRPRARLINS
jgi:4'-phosphopantetheinyl transferase